MKLIKQICIDCIKRAKQEQPNLLSWNKEDEKRWEDNEISCHMSYGIPVDAETALKTCTMALEQMVLRQNGNQT